MQAHLSVSDATALVKGCLEKELQPLWIEGEISNFVAHASGHFYFSIKDSGAQMRCVMFRGANRRLRIMPESGMSCALFGRIAVYERSGVYQLIAERLLPTGEGALQLAFDALKARLEDEGLFDPKRKQALPTRPRRIGLVTSHSGAAVRDMVKVLRRRWPRIQIILRPVLVQGDGAAADIASGISDIAAYGDIDLMIVGRGGGSIEDLWAFNEEIVVRSIFVCPIPIISAVGHEIDTTLSDFAADLRAPTPSAAAEIAVPDLADQLSLLRRNFDRCGQSIQRKISATKQRLNGISQGRALWSPLDRVRQESQRADELFQRCGRELTTRLARAKDRLRALDHQITALSPTAILGRGFALVFTDSGNLVRNAQDAATDSEIRVQLGAGVLRCRVEGHDQDLIKKHGEDPTVESR